MSAPASRTWWVRVDDVEEDNLTESDVETATHLIGWSK